MSMTNKNMFLNNKPFLLKPIGKDYLWGGSRLNDDFAKGIDMAPLAETWECSVHKDGLSIVDSGKYKGKTLLEVLNSHPEYLGRHDELPILVKFIDAKDDLSLQVHPSDEYAFKYENGQRGKSEMWYVVDATKDATIYYGFRDNISKEELKDSLNKGTIEKYLQKVHVNKDDVFFIEAGTVHAIGKGCLIAEIQESSNLTYRLYDYDRIDVSGNKRELHIQKALDVVNIKRAKEPRQPVRIMKYIPGSASEFLFRCKYFQVERMLINTERIKSLAKINIDETSFQILLCIDGCGLLTDEENVNIRFFKGDCIFVPASSGDIYLHGKASLLRIYC